MNRWNLSGDGKYYLARISYGVECSAFEATQFLNVVFGNSSLQPHIWVVDIDLAPSLIDALKDHDLVLKRYP